jgi:hypothetical protein
MSETKVSIIVCSINPELCKEMLNNISNTIGIEFEFIVFDNCEKKLGLGEVYNKCAYEATGEYLCFVHEDTLFGTKNWGKMLVDFAKNNSDCGIISFAGGQGMAKNAASWFFHENRMNVYDGYNGNNNPYLRLNYTYHKYLNPNNKIFEQAVCVDSFFIFVKKIVWNEIKFDAQKFKGIHFLDMDFSFAVSQKYKNFINLTTDVYHGKKNLTTNFTPPPTLISKDYIDNMFVFQNKWKNSLPYYLKKQTVIRKFVLELKSSLGMFHYAYPSVCGFLKCVKQIIKINGILFTIISLVYLFYKLILKLMAKMLKEIDLKL